MIFDIILDLVPEILPVPDAFAGVANVDDSLKRPNLSAGFVKLMADRGEGLHNEEEEEISGTGVPDENCGGREDFARGVYRDQPDNRTENSQDVTGRARSIPR